MKPHKHAELIKAWADGAEIEGRITESGNEWQFLAKPCWFSDDYIEYRIKPESNDECDEELLEQLYWEFDSDRKKYPENERIRFKGKLRYFANMKLQYIKPESKPDFTIEYFFKKGELLGAHKEQPPNLSLTFDGETGELKSAEVLC